MISALAAVINQCDGDWIRCICTYKVYSVTPLVLYDSVPDNSGQSITNYCRTYCLRRSRENVAQLTSLTVEPAHRILEDEHSV